MKTLLTLLLTTIATIAVAQPSIPKHSDKIIISYPGSSYGQALVHLKRVWADCGVIITIDTLTGTYATGPIGLPRCAGTTTLTGICHTINDTTWITTSGTTYSPPTTYGTFNYPWSYSSGCAKCSFKQCATLLINFYGDTRVWFK